MCICNGRRKGRGPGQVVRLETEPQSPKRERRVRTGNQFTSSPVTSQGVEGQRSGKE